MTKVCSKCGEERDIEQFYVDKYAASGRRSDCKPCNLRRVKAYHKAHTVERKVYTSRRYAENREALLAQQKVRYFAHQEDRLAYAAEYREKNKELLRLKDVARMKNEDRRAQHKAGRRKRKALLKWSADGQHHTGQDVAGLLVEQGGLCAYCHETLGADYHVDHIVPLAKGGSNGPDNICLACPACNLNKKDRLFGYEWCVCKRLQGRSANG